MRIWKCAVTIFMVGFLCTAGCSKNEPTVSDEAKKKAEEMMQKSQGKIPNPPAK